LENLESRFAKYTAPGSLHASRAPNVNEEEKCSMAKPVTLTLSPQDAEPILLDAARQAALYGAWCDYITPKTVNSPGNWQRDVFANQRKEWQAKFLRAKRIVEAFGVEYEPTSEEETLTVYIPNKNEKRRLRNIGGIDFTEVSGGEPDYAHPQPEYRRAVHSEACFQAAHRVVDRWRATIAAR
jgi:hypothetical protein